VCQFSSKSGFFDKHVKNSAEKFYGKPTNTLVTNTRPKTDKFHTIGL